ncbi:MAG: ABC transporter permease [Acidimicrobiales bacterium]
MTAPATAADPLAIADDRTRRRRPPKRARGGGTLPYRLLGYAGFLLLWQVMASRVSAVIIPGPTAVLDDISEIFTTGLFWPHFRASVVTILVGFAIAYVLGTIVGAVMGLSRWSDAFFRDWIMSTLMMPGLVVVIIVTMIMGLGGSTAIVAVVLTAIPYAAINVTEGVQSIPKDLFDMARAFRVRRWLRIRSLLIPALAPFLLTAARYAFSLAWKTTTLAEVIGGARGIGFMMKREFQLFSVSGFLAWCFIFFGLTIFIERFVLQRLINRAFRWRPEVSLRGMDR